ncbi:WXG100-like domain-containing protein [Nonomuraea sp. 3N208]|uniref:WXG100-like domain-containing protein n=1 Tax=Nonomuraea sp. 3N208 TaxID=3457421 RepID=UPI003FD2064C
MTTAINRLKQVASFLTSISNPVTMIGEIVSAICTVTSLFRDVPGNPDGIDELGKAFRKMATALDAAGTDIDHTRSSVPSVWKGDAATEALAALIATDDLLQTAAPAMRKADTLLQEYADEVRRLKKELGHHRQRLSEALGQLDSAQDLLRNVWDSVWPLDDDGGIVEEVRKAIGAIYGGVEVFEELWAASDALQRGLRDVQGKARAGAVRSRHVDAFDAVLLANAGIDGIAQEEGGILTTTQLAQAAAKMDALSEADRARMQGLLDGAGSEAERAYLMKALAAGHSIDDITTFATVIHGKSEIWLREHLSLVDPNGSGTVSVNGVELEQQNQTTCGSTAIMVARAMNDPLYALSLTTDENGNSLSPTELREKFTAEQNRIHDSTNTVWPQSLGTSPWGLTDEMNQHADSFGAKYDWRLVDDTSAGSVNPALNDAVGAVDAGHTVPVLIGDSYPAHYVLLVGHEDDDLIFYNPLTAEMVRVSEDDFRNGNVSGLGYTHVQGVVTPK